MNESITILKLKYAFKFPRNLDYVTSWRAKSEYNTCWRTNILYC